jgi:WXG100 family type VII secretion target
MNFEIELDQLSSCYSTYQTELENLQGIFDTLKSGIETLRDSEWRSDASTQFFSLYDDRWSQNMEGQLQIMEEMVALLKDAKDTYDRVDQAAADVKVP